MTGHHESTDATIGFAGGGQMARALAVGIVQAGASLPSQIHVVDPAAPALEQFQAAVPGCQIAASNATLLQTCDLVFVAVKPHHVPAVFSQGGTPLRPECLLVSIAAGVSLDQLTSWSGSQRVVRVMPNAACMVRSGAAAYSRAKGAGPEDGQWIRRLLSPLGYVTELPEELLDVVTGISGSGLGFAFLWIESLADGGSRLGLPRDVSLQMAAQTVRGAAEMVLATQQHPAVLRDRVASPGGTTWEGLYALEQQAVPAAIMHALERAAGKSAELRQLAVKPGESAKA